MQMLCSTCWSTIAFMCCCFSASSDPLRHARLHRVVQANHSYHPSEDGESYYHPWHCMTHCISTQQNVMLSPAPTLAPLPHPFLHSPLPAAPHYTNAGAGERDCASGCCGCCCAILRPCVWVTIAMYVHTYVRERYDADSVDWRQCHVNLLLLEIETE